MALSSGANASSAGRKKAQIKKTGFSKLRARVENSFAPYKEHQPEAEKWGGASESQLSENLYHLIPTPFPSGAMRDIYSLLAILFLQFAIVGKIIPFVYVELVLIWIMIAFVRHKPFSSFVLGGIAAMFLETHLSVPAGIYFLLFGVMGILIYVVRDHIFWRSQTPWIVCFLLAEVVSFVIELVSLMPLAIKLVELDFWFFISLIVRVIFIGLFGSFFAFYEAKREVEEGE